MQLCRHLCYVACARMFVGRNFFVRDINLCLLCDGFFGLEKYKADYFRCAHVALYVKYRSVV